VTVHQGHILKFPGGIYPRGLVPVLRGGGESMGPSLKGNALRTLQKKAAAKRHENLSPRDSWLRDEFAKKLKNPDYTVAQFRNWLKRKRKFSTELRPKGKLIGERRLSAIVYQGATPKNL
jgi:hypothetical protein